MFLHSEVISVFIQTFCTPEDNTINSNNNQIRQDTTWDLKERVSLHGEMYINDHSDMKFRDPGSPPSSAQNVPSSTSLLAAPAMSDKNVDMSPQGDSKPTPAPPPAYQAPPRQPLPQAPQQTYPPTASQIGEQYRSTRRQL